MCSQYVVSVNTVPIVEGISLSGETDPVTIASRYLRGLGVTALCTAVAYPVYPNFDPVNIVMVYLLGATLAGLRLGRGPAALTAIANTAAFDFLFVPPRYSFYVAETQYVFTLSVMLGVAFVIANLMASVRRQTDEAAERERLTAMLYAMSRELAVAPDAAAIADVAVRHVGTAMNGAAAVLFPDERARIPRDVQFSVPTVDIAVAQSVFDDIRSAGPGMQNSLRSPSLYLPLAGSTQAWGVLVVERAFGGALFAEQKALLEALAGQIALALERARLAESAASARVAAERAALRNTLLASISHDLRGPLSAIAGAGSLVAQSGDSLDREGRRTLGNLIEEKARDMTGLLSNVLELMRLENSNGLLRADWQSLEELIGTALRNTEERLGSYPVSTAIPPEFPLVFVDGQLMVQLLMNLFENVTRHTPRGTSVRLTASQRANQAVLRFEDDGPGFGSLDPERLLEKFERGREESAVGGVGLGLAICRAVARLHGCQISASNGPSGGARFEITLPLESPQSDCH
jgi:two-component system, OmpR family, sensor histidine kinase KdpD